MTSRRRTPVSSSALRCFEIAGFETPKPAVASPTLAGPAARRSTIPRRIGCESALNGSFTIWLTVALVGDRLPDQLGDVEDEIRLGLRRIGRGAHLANAHAHRVVEPPVPVGVAGVEDRPDDLAAPGRVGAPVAVPFDHDRRPVVGLDHRAEVRTKGSGRTLPPGVVRAAEAPADRALAAALGEEQMLLPAALEADRPALWIREPDPVQRLEFQRAS